MSTRPPKGSVRLCRLVASGLATVNKKAYLRFLKQIAENPRYHVSIRREALRLFERVGVPKTVMEWIERELRNSPRLARGVTKTLIQMRLEQGGTDGS